MRYTDDPVADFAAWDNDYASYLERLPMCSECREHIQDETGFYIDERWICESCMDMLYRKEVLPE